MRARPLWKWLRWEVTPPGPCPESLAPSDSRRSRVARLVFAQVLKYVVSLFLRATAGGSSLASNRSFGESRCGEHIPIRDWWPTSGNGAPPKSSPSCNGFTVALQAGGDLTVPPPSPGCSAPGGERASGTLGGARPRQVSPRAGDPIAARPASPDRSASRNRETHTRARSRVSIPSAAEPESRGDA